MKKILIFFSLLFLSVPCWSQGNSPVVGAGIMPSGPTLPTTCNPANVGDADSQAMFFHTTSAGGAIGLYVCSALNTWSAAGSGGISGQANNVIPKGTTATTITQQSSCTDNGTTFSCTEPVASTGAVTAGTGCTPAGATATGGVCMTEAASTGWTPTASFDYIRADSTQHTFLCSLNGGVESPCNSSALSAITAATGANTISNGNNAQIWNWTQTTNTQAGLKFGEAGAAVNGTITSNLANQSNLTASTLSNSTATPFNVLQGSITNTVATPLAQFQTTWNNASLAAMGLGISVTNTASAANSFPLWINVGNSTLLAVDKAGLLEFGGTATLTSAPPLSGLSESPGWRLCLGNGGGAGVTCTGYETQTEYHLVDQAGNAWFSVGSTLPNNDGGGANTDTNAGTSLSNGGLSGAVDGKEGTCTAYTPRAAHAIICMDSASHEFLANTNGASMATSTGMLVRRQPVAINSTGLTAAVTTATLCAASAGACNVAGQYEIIWNIWGSGTACGTPSPGGVTISFTWTDENSVSHAAVIPAANSQTTATATVVNVSAPTMAFQSALANESSSGTYVLSSSGAAAIQYAVAYTACGAGTGTYNLRASVVRIQ